MGFRLKRPCDHRFVRELCELCGTTVAMLDSGLTRWTAAPMFTFKPMGLLLWGCRNETLLQGLMVGNELSMVCSGDPVPGRFFESGRSFEDFTRLLVAPSPLIDDDEADCWFQGWLERQPIEVPERQIFEIATCLPGTHLNVNVTGPVDALAVWGVCQRLN
jgi:hypothetical protein